MYRKFILLVFLLLAGMNQALSADQPNIVWIIPDDMSAQFGCYGETAIETPNVDQLAKDGVMFTSAVVTSPVCSTCRSALITGMYQTTIGAHHHRSGRGTVKIQLPDHVQLVPKLFQDAGYYTTLSGWPINGKRSHRTDYNFEWDPSVYDGFDWANRRKGQPFFAQIMTPGGKLRGKDETGWERVMSSAEKKLGSRTGLDQVELPPYYPQHPDIINDWAAYLDSVRMTDAMVGEVIKRLEKEGLLENTLVIFMTDHGISHARGKQFMYEEGIRVPLVIRGPGIAPGTVRNDVVEHIDLAAISLAAAGIDVPDYMQGRNVFATDYQFRDAVFSARDRCDETVDHMRAVRTNEFKYIRNFLPNRPYLQPCAYKDAKKILIALREWHSQGKLNDVQSLHLANSRPPEELYDLNEDPFEINNLADNPKYADQLRELRKQLDDWMERTGDQGRNPEPEAMYDSDMRVYIGNFERRKNPKDQAYLRTIKENIALMKKWAAEGR